MKKEYAEIEIDLGIKELEAKIQQIQEKKTELWGLIYEAREIAGKYNFKITFK